MTSPVTPILEPYHLITLDVHKDLWMTSNQRKHWAENSKRANRLRTLADFKARAHRTPKITEPVWLHAAIAIPSNSRFDPPNAWPTVKPIIDGLVLAGIFKDDDSKWIPYTSFGRDHTKPAPGHYRITLYAIPESSEIYVPF